MRQIIYWIMEKTRIKVLFAMHLPPPVHGASMVGEYIKQSGVVNSTFDCRFENIATADTLTDIGKFSVKKIFDVFGLVKRLKKVAREFLPDIVYYTPNAKGLPFYKDFVVVEALKRCGCRVILHFHNKGVLTRQNRWMDNMLYRIFFKDVTVMLLAEALYKDVEKYVDRDNVVICENGIPDILQECPRKGEGGTPRLLFLSNMMETKGVWDLLDALHVLKERSKAFTCDFVGGWKDIREEDFRNRVKKLGLDDCVFARGPKYGKDKEVFLQEADIFVFPTYYPKECFPLVLLEAMAHGIACISTDEGGIPGIIDDGKTGFMVERQNVGQLAARIETLLDNPQLCKDMGTAGRKRFEDEFTLDKFEHRFSEILESVVSGKA